MSTAPTPDNDPVGSRRRYDVATDLHDQLQQIKSIASAAAAFAALAALFGLLIILGVGVTDAGHPF